MYSAFKRALGNLGSWVAKTSIITAFMFGGIGLYFVHSSKQKVKGAICIEVSPNEGDNEDLSSFSDLHGVSSGVSSCVPSVALYSLEHS